LVNNLAELYRTTGAYAKAEPLYQRALVINEKALGPEHPTTATSLCAQFRRQVTPITLEGVREVIPSRPTTRWI
jgi:hypothetical protein